MSDCCCLCWAIGENRPGRIPDGGGFPMCAEHRARSIWNSRRPKPLTIGSPYENAIALAVLGDDDSLSLGASLAGIAAPTTETLQ